VCYIVVTRWIANNQTITDCISSVFMLIGEVRGLGLGLEGSVLVNITGI